MAFGVLTLASKSDYLKAIGLSLSVRISNPGVPVAIACAKEIQSYVDPYFDFVIDEDDSLRGFEHKINLDRYTPFDTTFFFDADILVFKQLAPVVDEWGEQAYIARGNFLSEGYSSFGLDRKAVLEKIGKEKLVVIDGAGHALFRMPSATPVFDKARAIAKDYENYVGNIRFADEDVMSIALTLLGYSPAKNKGFFSRYLSAKPGTLEIRAEDAFCRFIEVSNDAIVEPVMMHFAANEGGLAYAHQLHRLFSKFGVGMKASLYTQGLRDIYSYNKLKIRNKLMNIFDSSA